VIAGIAGVEHALIGMAEKEIGGEHRVAVVGATHRLVPGVLHEAVALVHQDDRRKPAASRWVGQEGRHPVAAGDPLGSDIDMPGGDRHSVLRASSCHQLHGLYGKVNTDGALLRSRSSASRTIWRTMSPAGRISLMRPTASPTNTPVLSTSPSPWCRV